MTTNPTQLRRTASSMRAHAVAVDDVPGAWQDTGAVWRDAAAARDALAAALTARAAALFPTVAVDDAADLLGALLDTAHDDARYDAVVRLAAVAGIDVDDAVRMASACGFLTIDRDAFTDADPVLYAPPVAPHPTLRRLPRIDDGRGVEVRGHRWGAYVTASMSDGETSTAHASMRDRIDARRARRAAHVSSMLCDDAVRRADLLLHVTATDAAPYWPYIDDDGAHVPGMALLGTDDYSWSQAIGHRDYVHGMGNSVNGGIESARRRRATVARASVNYAPPIIDLRAVDVVRDAVTGETVRYLRGLPDLAYDPAIVDDVPRAQSEARRPWQTVRYGAECVLKWYVTADRRRRIDANGVPVVDEYTRERMTVRTVRDGLAVDDAGRIIDAGALVDVTVPVVDVVRLAAHDAATVVPGRRTVRRAVRRRTPPGFTKTRARARRATVAVDVSGIDIDDAVRQWATDALRAPATATPHRWTATDANGARITATTSVDAVTRNGVTAHRFRTVSSIIDANGARVRRMTTAHHVDAVVRAVVRTVRPA